MVPTFSASRMKGFNRIPTGSNRIPIKAFVCQLFFLAFTFESACVITSDIDPLNLNLMCSKCISFFHQVHFTTFCVNQTTGVSSHFREGPFPNHTFIQANPTGWPPRRWGSQHWRKAMEPLDVRNLVIYKGPPRHGQAVFGGYGDWGMGWGDEEMWEHG